ncbi:DNA-3-methyladenine glycosylase 2 family protein [Pedobacter yonginense]|uniref:DNA-3-methyladenine glycosylase II n=1 Tax=Pedobacter yonginense TaxID=651869 RepID=A0A317ETX0_9SPHI|nr:DNA-3-methyladenine glycosylase [Pedobacter yonginense]PWS29343.1 DNA-3-methyladenine glycosylase 2 family protein [Pedobacter yonginense]
MFERFEQGQFHTICDQLAALDEDMKLILDRYGYPPFWARPNTFESLVHIILEQQVSLASALAALNKLRGKIDLITPERLLSLSNEDLRACYFSRQKTIYVRHLAEKLVHGELSLEALELMNDDEVRHQLKLVKGIGDWTVDIYLIFILHHTDVFPLGDLAAVNALKQLKKLDASSSKEDILFTALHWKPYRSVAVMMLWHYYLEKRRLGHK